MFLERLLKLIDERGITKNKLLTDLGLSKNSFVDWSSRGTIPSGETLLKISRYFSVPIDYLLGNDGFEKTSKEIQSAREVTKSWIHSTDMSISDIKEKLNVENGDAYATLRAWADGYGSYFNDKLYVIADLIGCSVDFLMGRTNVFAPYGSKVDEDEIDEIISALPDKTDDTVTMRIAAFGGGVHEVKVSKDDLRDVVNMLEEEEEN